MHSTMLSRTGLLVGLLANFALTSSAGFINPEPVSVCSSGAGPGQTACASVPDACCSSGGGECCAGGCCPAKAVCINKGRGDEGCCPIDDPTTCGKVLPTVSVCSGSAAPSVTCSAGDGSTWVCGPDKACGVRFNVCLDAPNVCVTTADGSGSTTTTAGTSTAGGGPAATGSGSPSGSGTPLTGEVSGGLVGVLGALVAGVALVAIF
ncbi:hypothetical protein QBC47DRAFT_465641 [Echria macrotheca]|uniref:Uncharacterized protein n=1 Tax=Echria macrotheca TaxID=438768 RepID=A0AAJ0B0I5_9PEZI|nr:hypothetical protein QBC47DRAFT_465641 [Echria macrotheca]